MKTFYRMIQIVFNHVNSIWVIKPDGKIHFQDIDLNEIKQKRKMLFSKVVSKIVETHYKTSTKTGYV